MVKNHIFDKNLKLLECFKLLFIGETESQK